MVLTHPQLNCLFHLWYCIVDCIVQVRVLQFSNNNLTSHAVFQQFSSCHKLKNDRIYLQEHVLPVRFILYDFIACTRAVPRLLKHLKRFSASNHFNILCPAALHTIAHISMLIFPISLIFLVSGILFL
jgi:hypothetical protein